MKKIQLGGHRYKNRLIRAYALVDDVDYEELNKYQWSAGIHRGVIYAKRGGAGVPVVYMHRQIMGTLKRMYTDHIDGDTLNNQRANLRICTNAQNLRNRGKNRNNNTSYKGVSLHKSTGKYRARIKVLNKEIHLGLFGDIEDASKAYDKAAKEYFREFAKT